VTPPALPGIIDEARRLIAAAGGQGVPVRLIGGVAVRLRADASFEPALSRDYRDIDLVTVKGGSKKVTAFLEEMGYQPQLAFNSLNGSDRLLFHDVANARQLDVFVGTFRMCHAIPVGDRLTVDDVTLPLAELLLTKLQIVKLNEKDLRDMVAILHHQEVADHDGDAINALRIAKLCADDWGLWRTSKMNLERVREGAAAYGLAPSDLRAIEARIERIWREIESTPKPRAWRLRDRIGDRKRWYDDPEEVAAE
jgi:hypothetical protein